jgi:cell wall-associated NlpC family hydrolase
MVPVERTCFRIAAWLTKGYTRLAIHIVFLLACGAFMATGAEARQKTTVAKQSSVKKVAITPKAKAKKSVKLGNSEPLATSTKSSTKNTKKPAAVTRKAKAKKSVKFGNSELPAAPPEFFTKNSTKPFSGVSINRRVADLQLRGELERYLGTRYKRGGTGGDGFDCSGFARSMYRKLFGVDLPHNAQSQFHLPMFAKLNEKALKTGDLVFFASTAKKKRISHVGIYLDDGQFIHAQSKRGVVISNMDDDYWRKRLVSAKRLGG